MVLSILVCGKKALLLSYLEGLLVLFPLTVFQEEYSLHLGSKAGSLCPIPSTHVLGHLNSRDLWSLRNQVGWLELPEAKTPQQVICTKAAVLGWRKCRWGITYLELPSLPISHFQLLIVHSKNVQVPTMCPKQWQVVPNTTIIFVECLLCVKNAWKMSHALAHVTLPALCEVKLVKFSILPMRKLGHKQVKQIAQGHTDRKERNQDFFFLF